MKTTYHLGSFYGVNINNGNLTLQEIFGSYSIAKGELPDFFGWAEAKAWAQTEMMSCRFMEASYHDAFWKGENGNYNSPAPGHAINIEIPAGRYLVTTSLPFAQGKYSGEGSRFHDQNGTHSYGSTELVIDNINWKLNKFPNKLIMRSSNWGVEGGYGAWCHHTIIESICFNMGSGGNVWMPNDNIEYAGIGFWDAGEASEVRNCYFNNSPKDGIINVRGTPILITGCSAFTCARFGFALVGGGSATYVGISGDESGIALIGGIEGYNRPGTGRIAVFGAKQETSTSAEFKPWKGSSFMRLEGWYSVSVHGVSFASGWTNPYDFISWKKGPSNFSSIDVTGTLFFGNHPRCLFYDETNNLEYLFEGNAWQNEMQSFSWHESKGLKTNWKTITPVKRNNTPGRLQHTGQDGANSWDTAKLYDPTNGGMAQLNPTPNPNPTPIPNPPTPTPEPEPEVPNPIPPSTEYKLIASYDFSNSTTARIKAQTGTDLTQSVSWLRASSISNGLMVNNNTLMRYSCNWNGVRKIKIIKFNPSNLSAGQYICTNNSNKGLVITANRKIAINTSGSDIELTPALEINKEIDLEIILPNPVDFVNFGATPSAGNSFRARLDKIEIYN